MADQKPDDDQPAPTAPTVPTAPQDVLPTKLPAHGVPANVAHVEVDEHDNRRLKFSDERINAALDRQLGGIDPGAKVAVVATAFKDHSGELQTKLAVYINRKGVLGGDLSFGGFLAGDAKHPLDTVGAEVAWVSH